MPIGFELLSRYVLRYPIFVETGTYMGEGVAVALFAGYNSVYSAEIDRVRYALAKRRREERGSDERLFCTPSVEMLEAVIPVLVAPVFFWLDAHDIDGRGEIGPLREEIRVIGWMTMVEHVIAVDDVSLLPSMYGGGEEELREQILAVGSYGIEREGDILLAESVPRQGADTTKGGIQSG